MNPVLKLAHIYGDLVYYYSFLSISPKLLGMGGGPPLATALSVHFGFVVNDYNKLTPCSKGNISKLQSNTELSKTSFEKNCFSAWVSTLNMGLINKIDNGMFVACGIWCLADVSSVSPSSEQTLFFFL